MKKVQKKKKGPCNVNIQSLNAQFWIHFGLYLGLWLIFYDFTSVITYYFA